MKYLDEYRAGDSVKKIIKKIEDTVTKNWVLMEVCGGQTHSIIRYGLDELLPKKIELVHGPGCPVCVTALELIDQALALAAKPEVIFTSYGDMLRVPGTFYKSKSGYQANDLFSIKSKGGDVRIVYSPLDALKIAQENPEKTVVFFAIGFETTAPANAMAIKQAKALGIKNFCVLVSHVTVPPAISAVMSAETCRVQGFLAAGHVCTVMGISEYKPLVEKYKIPIVVTGFEPVDLCLGILKLVEQLEAGECYVDNAYSRTSPDEGNATAQDVIGDVFEICDRAWRGLGVIPKSGYKLSAKYKDYDALERFEEIKKIKAVEPNICQSGEVLQGNIKPYECPAFGKQCTPLTPLGATMVSSEGACAAYYKYGRHKDKK